MKKVGLGEEPAAASKEEEDKELHDDVEQGRRNNNQGSPMKKTSACNQVDPFASTPKPSSGEKQAPALTCNPGAARALTTLLSDLMKHPHLLIAPLLVFCLVAALCSYGIMRATEASYKLEERHARDAANYAADGLAKQLSTACRAVLSLAAVVKMNPSWPFLESNFQVLAKELFRQSYDEGNLSLEELALIPFGRVSLNYGLIHNHTTHTDLFSPDHVNVLGPYRSLAQRGLTLSGPIPLTNTEEKAFAARYPVFFPDTDEDESWGHPDNITHPTDCPGPPCYIPATREKFWGFIGVLVDAKPLQAGKNVHLERLLSDDLSYSLTTSFLAGSNAPGTLVSGGPNADKVTATADVDLPGSSWSLSVYDPRLSDILRLRKGLLALVVIVAFIKAVLLLLLLLSSKRASIYLQEQLVTNKLLQEEKESRETLLNRQLDLIACFEQSTKCTRNLSRSRNVIRRQSTLDQIAAARSAISGMTLSKEEDISVQELLAEGSFGRVYRGKWRAIDVAVKIIMLPGNMSGREKREKMIVWEAAISSSLVHPNVCQTYHYRIKPVKDSAQPGQEIGSFSPAVIYGDQSGSRHGSVIHTDGIDGCSKSFSTENVHSYEVQLILEYCDRSSLRDALDAGLFMTPNGLNYAALLDCALDVAKAMLHLHCNNVLHLDLKTRNILLASSGADDKGVICKVSDFGLSVCMDQSETHVSSLFHGTLTHMAPEVLLKGTCSKASDVYAFGMVLWELYTSSFPFHDVPRVLLGHLIVKAKRPPWPLSVPKGYMDLANACWDQNPDARPTFEVILEALHNLRRRLGFPTPPLQPACVRQPEGVRPLSQLQEDWTLFQPSSAQLQLHDSREFLQSKGPSTPSQAEFLQTMGLSAPSQAPSCSSKGALGLTLQEGAPSASLGKAVRRQGEHEEDATCGASFGHGKAGQDGLVHLRPATWEGAVQMPAAGTERSSPSNMFSHSLRGLLTISTPDTLRALQSTSPGTGSALPVRDPEANVPSASTNGHVNNSLRQGACHPSCPLGGTGPLHTRCSEAQTQERQSWALARIGGSEGQISHPS